MEEQPERHDVELYLLRHADAGDPEAWQADDDLRPLSEKGRRQCEALGRFLRSRDFAVDAILASPRVRAVETAELVARALGASVTQDDRLAKPLDVGRLGGLLEGLAGRRIMLVGHDPDFSELAASLSGASYLPLKKGALARIDVSLPVQPAGGILRWLLPPSLVKAG